MLILELVAVAILLAVFFQMLRAPRDPELSLLELETEMMALDAECARAAQGTDQEADLLKQPG